jgi:hypothetical protein
MAIAEVLRAALAPIPGASEVLRARLLEGPGSAVELLALIRDLTPSASAADSADHRLLLVAVIAFYRHGCCVPDGGLAVFFALLDVAPPAFYFALAGIVNRSFASAPACAAALARCRGAGAVYCVPRSRLGPPLVCEWFAAFAEQLCDAGLDVALRREYARSFAESPDVADRPDAYWGAVARLLATAADGAPFAAVLAAIVAREGVLAPPPLAAALLRRVPPLEALYAGAGAGPAALALEGVLRQAGAALAAPWDDAEYRAIFDACWRLLAPRASEGEYIDDFFAAYIDSDSCEGSAVSVEGEIHGAILCSIQQLDAMCSLAVEKIASLPELDVPAVTLLAGLRGRIDFGGEIPLTSRDPVWLLHAITYNHQCGRLPPEELWVELLTSADKKDVIVGVELAQSIGSVSELVARLVLLGGLRLLATFQTERVVEYFDMFTRLIKDWLKSADVRVGIRAVICEALEIAWETTIQTVTLQLVAPLAVFITRFMRYHEFQEFVEPLILRPFAAVLEHYPLKAIECASPLILKHGLVPDDGLKGALAQIASMRFRERDWSPELWEIALYLARCGVTFSEEIEGVMLGALEQLSIYDAPWFHAFLMEYVQVMPVETIALLLTVAEQSSVDIAKMAQCLMLAAAYLARDDIAADSAIQLAPLCLETLRAWCYNRFQWQVIIAFVCKMAVESHSAKLRRAALDLLVEYQRRYCPDGTEDVDIKILRVEKLASERFSWVASSARAFLAQVAVFFD